MRAAFERIKELYGTEVGQDVIETLLGAATSAGGQAIFTDMTPEEIALATGVGVGAAVVGRPAGGALGHAVGKQLGKHNVLNKEADQLINWMMENYPKPVAEALKLKLKPYEDRESIDKFLSMYGRARGDNIAQAGVAFAAPFVMPDNSEEVKIEV